MSKDLVVKSNKLVRAIQNLSLTEVRLIQLAIVDARESGRGLDSKTPLRIDAERYAEAFGVTKEAAYDTMLHAEKQLFERRFTFLSERNNPVKSTWIQQVEYMRGEFSIEIVLSVAVVNEISRIDGQEQFFTQYALSQTAKLSSVYAARLYELLIQWRTTGKTQFFELELLREQLGLCVNEYPRMCDFKRRVLDLAVSQINEHTDITVNYEQHKRGRIITGFSFTFKQKSTPKPTQPSKQPVNALKTQNNAVLATFSGLEIALMREIQKKHPEITEKYVCDFAGFEKIDVFAALQKIKTHYKGADSFSLEKTD